MKVLVTGITGFIGGYIFDKLNLRNDIEVIGVARRKIDKYKNYNNIIYCDLAEKFEYNERADVLIHCAGLCPKKGITMIEYIKGNIYITHNIVKYAEKYNVDKVIYLSSVSMYGEVKNGIINDDTSIINPSNYGVSKYIAQTLLEQSEIKSISLILPGVVSKKNKDSDVWLLNIINKLKRNEDIFVYNSNCKFNNIVYINDLVDFVEELLEHSIKKFEKVYLGTEDFLKIGEICEILKEKIKSSSNIIEKESNNKSFVMDICKAKMFGYVPSKIDDILESLI